MTKYLIKLRPLDTFFFSQENKYRKKQKKDEKDNNGNILPNIEADYFQRSAYFPQQTTLLGMLRYYILLNNNQIPITDKAAAIELVGKNSFNVGASKPTFGKIKNLSTVFITDDRNNFYFQNPKDLILKNNKPIYLKRDIANIKSNVSKDMLFFDNYIEKDGLDSFLINSENNILPFDFDVDYDKNTENKLPNGIFIEKEKVGIKKAKNGQALNSAFYKQVFYSLQKGYYFGIIADLDDIKEEDQKGFAVIGAEKSVFSISLEKFDTELQDSIILKNNNSPKVILLADAYLSKYDTNDFLFAISSTKTFRFLETTVQKGKKYYSSNPLEKKEMKRSEKYTLFERGSVFYFKEANQLNKFTDKLDNEKIFNQIGYNQYKIII